MSTSDLRGRLRSRLTTALRERDRAAAGALRSMLAALENAEAVPVEAGSGPTIGVGTADVPRRELDAAAERSVVERELAELRAAAEEYDAHGDSGRAADLRRAAELIRAVT